MSIIRSIAATFSMFTIFPISTKGIKEREFDNILTLFPLVGIVIGGIWGTVFYITTVMYVEKMVLAVLVAVLPMILSGFLHVDGFMDICDAVMSRKPIDIQLKILKDSHVGAFAVIWLAILLSLQIAVLYALIEKNSSTHYFIVITTLSRSLSATYMLNLKSIGQSSMLSMMKENSHKLYKMIPVVFLIGCIVVAGFMGLEYVISSIVMVCTFTLCVGLLYRHFGGVSGDIAGFSVVVTELVGLLFLL